MNGVSRQVEKKYPSNAFRIRVENTLTQDCSVSRASVRHAADACYIGYVAVTTISAASARVSSKGYSIMIQLIEIELTGQSAIRLDYRFLSLRSNASLCPALVRFFVAIGSGSKSTVPVK